MKFEVTFKTPDAVHYAIETYLDEKKDALPEHLSPSDCEVAEYEIESQRDELEEFFKKWVRYGEIISIEFDTEAGTATVQECR